jgi:glycosyl transferase, family 25
VCMRMNIPTEASPVATSPDHKRDRARARPRQTVRPAQRRTIPAFYINRDCDLARRAAIEAELGEAGIAGERICAVDGLVVPPALREYFFNGDRLASRLEPGEVGCYASHLKALSVVAARGLECALVLEDDALLPRDLSQTIETILTTLPKDWDLVHLCGDVSRAFKPIVDLGGCGKIVRYSRIPANAQGYLISHRGAEKFLVPVKRHWPVDTDFRRPWGFGLQVYGIVPKIVGHNEALGSAILSLGGRARGRRGIRRPSVECWTGNPLHCPEGFLHNLRTLGPLSWAACLLRNAMRQTASMLGLRSRVKGASPPRAAASRGA